jgi:hypothetical protein
MKEIGSSDKVENRTSGMPEESRPQGNPISKTNDNVNVLRQARKLASRGFKCDWCGEIKAGMRRTGPRICSGCWKLHIEKKKSIDGIAYGRRIQTSGKRN